MIHTSPPHTQSLQVLTLAWTRTEGVDLVLAVTEVVIESVLSLPCVDEPTNLVLLEELAVVIHVVPVSRILVGANISLAALVVLVRTPASHYVS